MLRCIWFRPLISTRVLVCCAGGAVANLASVASSAILAGGIDQPAVAAQVPQSNLETLDPSALADLLDHGDFITRQRAEELLLSQSDLPLTELERLIRQPRSPEAQLRLERAGFNRFARTPRGAMGVQFDTSAIGRTVIENTTPGFDSGRVLRPGDEIIAIEGEAIANDFSTEFGFSSRNPIRPLVISRDPGQRITMTIKRKGELMDVELELGSFDRLRQPNLGGLGQSLADTELQAGWAHRLMRIRAQRGPSAPGEPAPTTSTKTGLDLRFTDQAWNATTPERRGNTTADDRLALQHALQLNGQIPSVVAGGQPRFVGRASPAGGYGANFNLSANTTTINNGGRVQVFQGIIRREIVPEVWVGQNDLKVGDLQSLRTAITQQRLMIEQWRNMANNARDAQTAAAINEQIRIFDKQLTDLQRQLTELRNNEKQPTTVIRPGEKPALERASPAIKPGLDGKDGPPAKQP